jgi:DNA repair protein RecN (Recombination protein N)
MPNIDNEFPSQWLKASDFDEDGTVMTIASYQRESIKNRDGVMEAKPVLYFRGNDKGLILNKTNAAKLTKLRQKASKKLATEVEALLPDLGLPGGRFVVHLEPTGISASGAERVEFRVALNVGHDARPLARTASGGELSRMMLALKTMAVADGAGKTLIFDEVDAGIGGEVAEVVGHKLQQLGGRFQVICITHLPQIASRASTHYHLEKSIRGRRTVTEVQRLDAAGRIEEISRMISGRSVTEPVRASAKLMLGIEAKGKQKAKGESESR